MGAQAQRVEEEQNLYARLAAVGLVVSPPTVHPGTPVRRPRQIPGISLSETVVRMRYEDEAETDA